MTESAFGQPRENEVEKVKNFSTTTGFLFSCSSIEELGAAVQDIAEAGRVDTVMLTEYDLSLEDVIANAKKISEIARTKKIAIVMAPKSASIGGRAKWDEQQKLLEAAGVTIIDGTVANKETRDSTGLYFDKTGAAYAFPKSWEHPIHHIPNTRIAVSICGEIRNVKPADLDGFDIDMIYNPSREGDDPTLFFRTVALANPEITDEALKNLLTQYYSENQPQIPEERQALLDKLDPYYRELILEDDKKNVPETQTEIDERKAASKQVVKDAMTRKNTPSPYVRSIADKLAERKIIVIRSDGRASGILNPMAGLSVSETKLEKDHARVSLNFQG